MEASTRPGPQQMGHWGKGEGKRRHWQDTDEKEPMRCAMRDLQLPLWPRLNNVYQDRVSTQITAQPIPSLTSSPSTVLLLTAFPAQLPSHTGRQPGRTQRLLGTPPDTQQGGADSLQMARRPPLTNRTSSKGSAAWSSRAQTNMSTARLCRGTLRPTEAVGTGLVSLPVSHEESLRKRARWTLHGFEAYESQSTTA
jgi:hypothetical protein